MKKIVLSLVLFVFGMLTVNAESCTIVSGDGKHIGDQVKCGTEYFRVLENDGTEVKMLTEYNLYVGFNIEKSKEEFDDYDDAWDFCDENYDNYEVRERVNASTGDSKYFCRIYTPIEEEDVLQRDDAIGFYKGQDGNWAYPQIGVNYLDEDIAYSESKIDGSGERIIEFGDIIFRNTWIDIYFKEYKLSLKNMGVNVLGIDFLKMKGLEDAISKMLGKKYTLYDFDYEEFRDYELSASGMKVPIRDIIPEQYRWIYQTSYWLGSGFTDHSYGYDETYFDMIISSTGALCELERQCNYQGAGAGLRPVVTISASDLGYIVNTKTDGNGIIKVSKENAKNGEEVTFEVIPNKGYVLGSVKVTDSDGNVIIFTSNKFTMPSSNVLVEANFKIENPFTGANVSFVVVIGLMVSCLFLVCSLYKSKLYKI